MSKITNGVKKALKKIFKGVKKIFKKITKSWIGKIILAAVVIYTGGVLLGAWGSTGPMSGMYGAWGGGAAATSTAAETAAVLEGGAVASTAAETAAVLEGGAALSSAAETAAVLEGGTAVATGAAPIMSTAAETAAILEGVAPVVEETLLGSLWSGVKSAATLAQANPIPAMMLMQGVSSALTPDQPNQIDILREEDTLRRARYDRAFSGSFERMPRLSSRTPEMLYQQNTRPWHTQGS